MARQKCTQLRTAVVNLYNSTLGRNRFYQVYLAFKGVASKSTIHRIIARSKEHNNVVAKARPGRTVKKAMQKICEKFRKIEKNR
jgi:hypothetical protein